MGSFLDFFEDQKFVDWVLRPLPELESYREAHLADHPGDKKELEYARIILSQLKPLQEECESPAEATAIYTKIIHHLAGEKKEKHHPAVSIIMPFLRYAAVAVIILFLGILLFNQYNKSRILEKYQYAGEIKNTREARLILADGEKILLDEDESTIRYDRKGKIIINNKDTLDQASSAGQEMNQLIVPFGKNSSISLPDGTVAFLNAGSLLVYPTEFHGKSREVFLSGEGYFEVAHNPELPFVVRTNDISVIATGTSFNVSAYPTDKILETVLVDGTLVLRGNSLNIFKKEILLNSGELAGFNRETMEASVRQVDVTDYVAWHKGYMIFQSTDLGRIVLKLERYYDIKIYLDNPMLGIRRITGKLMLREEKDKVLGVLASTARVTLFKIDGSTYGLR